MHARATPAARAHAPLISVVLVVLVAAFLAGGPGAQASAGRIAITSSMVEIEDVNSPGTWLPVVGGLSERIVYEGTAARVAMTVSNPGDVTTASITVTLAGVNRTVGSVSRTIGPGSQAVTVPLDLSTGAWVSTGVANGDASGRVALTITMTYEFRDLPGSTAPQPTPTPMATPTPTPSTAVEPLGEPSAAPTPTLVTPRPLLLTFPEGASGPSASMRRALRAYVAVIPGNASITASVRGVIPARDVTRGDRAGARERAASVARVLDRTATFRASGTLTRILDPVRSSDESDWSSVRVRISWSVTSESPPQDGAANRRKPRNATEQSTASTSMLLAPRPTVLVHGLWSTATTAWAKFAAWQSGTHPLWLARAVDTMNTGALLSPFGAVNSVSQNADAAWAYLQNVRTTLNAHEVDVVAHSMGGIITRRMLHFDSLTQRAQAQAAIRSVVMLGTPNGGTSCANVWAVAATAPLKPSAMSAFNTSYPGYPGVYSVLAYTRWMGITCVEGAAGDGVVPAWSARSQVVNRIIDATTETTCGSSLAATCNVWHNDMTEDRGWYVTYVVGNLAVPTPPDTGTSAAGDGTEGATGTEIAKGTVGTAITDGTITTATGVSVPAGGKLAVTVVDPSDSTATYSVVVTTTGTVTSALTPSAGEYRVSTAEVSGITDPATVDLLVTGTIPAGSEWSIVTLPAS